MKSESSQTLHRQQRNWNVPRSRNVVNTSVKQSMWHQWLNFSFATLREYFFFCAKKTKIIGMGRYTYLPIRYYHDTWVPIRYVLWFFFFKNFDSTSIVIRYCYVLRFLFLFLTLDQGWETLILEGHSPAEFSSNPNQTHLNQLIKVFRMQLGIFFPQGFSGLELNSAGEWPSRINVPHPCFRPWEKVEWYT